MKSTATIDGNNDGWQQMSYLSYLDESLVLGQRFTLHSAENATLVLSDRSGKQRSFIDLICAYGSVNFGHNNPHIRFTGNEPAHLVASCYPPEGEAVARWLCQKLDLPTYKVMYQVGGSFAVSTAFALAQRARPGKIAALVGGFHGLGLDSISATSAHREFALHNTPLAALLESHITRIEVGGAIPASWDGISCLIYEPIQGANGYVPLPAKWLQELHGSAARAGVITIADEIQCGYFRHGRLSPSRSLGLTPDILLYSKSFTNGLYPMSAVVFSQHLERGFSGPVALAHTYQTAALGCYAAARVASYIDDHPLDTMMERIGAHLGAVASELSDLPWIDKVYSSGPTLSFGMREGRAKRLVTRCAERGILPFTGGMHGDRVRVAPPLTIEKETLEHATRILLEVARELRE